MVGLKYTYLIINLASILVPFIWSFEPRVRFIKYWRETLQAILIMAAIFIPLDILYTDWGVWGFNEKYITGFKIFGLPLEEIMFFLCIPYASVFTHEVLKYYLPKTPLALKTKYISTSLLIGLLILAIFNYQKLYTGPYAILAVLVIIFIQFVGKGRWLGRIYFSYIVLLIPFFIVNGLLTGFGLNEPVVWYNNAENLGIRLLTIPIEDSIYGFSMLAISMYSFEYFKSRRAIGTSQAI